ncbi:DUF1761 domain-containing protein [Aeromicrobium sp.]|uniref:DUF1761 domain-containing protein n=1 Tax=Aeromicrobium sp. TaxID=1871063 RepID=UPI003D6A8915
MTPEINHVAVVLAVVAAMIVGFVFYLPAVFGRRWMEMVGHSDESVEGGPAFIYPVVIVAGFVTAYALAGVTFLSHEFYQGGFLLSALVSAWILWLAFTAARMLVHDLFDTRTLQITALTALNELITVTAMALVIGLWPPSGI